MNRFGQCKHFGSCGGCTTQGVSYKSELTLKQKGVETLFSPLNVPVLPIVASDFPWQYRNKMEFSFSQSKKGDRYLGLMMRGGRGKVVTLEECHLVDGWFSDLLSGVRTWWVESGLEAYFPPKDCGHLRTLTLRQSFFTKQKMAILTLSGNAAYPVSEEEESRFGDVAKRYGVDACIIRRQIIAKKTPTRFVDTHLFGPPWIDESLSCGSKTLKFKIRPTSFFQPNTEQAQKIYQKSVEIADLKGSEVVLDLYCGTGAIGMFASFHAKKVLGIELNPDSVADAQENLIANGISNMEVLGGDVGETLGGDLIPDVVFVDPPRAGLCAKTIAKLKTLRPQKIVYISCNPVTQVENIIEFIKNGYRLVSVLPIDQFPHTPHVETIALLTTI